MKTPVLTAADMEREKTAFPTLDPGEMAAARECGKTEICEANQSLYEAGQQLVDFFVVVSGAWPLTDRLPCALETSCPGIFAAGDCRSRTTKRVAFAVGDGALAVTCVHDFLGTYA